MDFIPNKTAFIFPGQGSQKVGMGQDLASTYLVAKSTYEEADSILGIGLSKISWEGPEEELNDTINTQPALLVHSVAALRIFQDHYPNITPAYVAGHSMGELSALVAASAMSFPEALRLVRTRGELMKHTGTNSPGGMGAILGLDLQQVEKICTEASSPDEVVQIANDNCPGQVVISGASNALERAMPLAKEAGARKAVPLAVSIAAHSPLMAEAQEGFNSAVEAAQIFDPKIFVIGNVSAQPLVNADEIRADLQAQLSSRVRWTESIQHLIDQGITNFIELGSEKVLSGLVKRVERTSNRMAFGTHQDFETNKANG
ncbi:MAG: ACP S-malonyltransferase [Chloroflexi bacterium]|nr:ACP S-malonyltransferase [Chloroflexota bacterium]